jgi:epoxyqueuosine reductase QueG
MMDDLAPFIHELIAEQVGCAQTITCYGVPLVGFVAAGDPGFRHLQEAVTPGHYLPTDLLPGARTVVAFFLPFAPDVVEANRAAHPKVAREWAVAYVETNRLLSEIAEGLVEGLAAWGVEAVARPPTHDFDPQSLSSRWSHKSVAMLAGLGSFGLHHMLITEAGCAGRCNSVVMDAEILTKASPERERCLALAGGRCSACIQRCPVGALTFEGLDRAACYRHLLSVDAQFADLGVTDVCGQCAMGPCATLSVRG